MHSSKSEKKMTQVDVSELDSQDSCHGIGGRIAPAVALLLLGDSVSADEETTYVDDSMDDDLVTVPEPSVLTLLAVGAVVVGTAKYIHNKRRKK